MNGINHDVVGRYMRKNVTFPIISKMMFRSEVVCKAHQCHSCTSLAPDV